MQLEVVDLEDYSDSPLIYGHSSTIVGSSLFVFGGAYIANPSQSSSPVFSSSMRVFDLEDLGVPPLEYVDEERAGRHFHSCVVKENSLYIFGGKSNGYRNDIVCFTPANGSFETIEPSVESSVPSRRWGHSASIRSRTDGSLSMLIFGGYDSNGFVQNTLYEFVFDTRSWCRIDISMYGIPRRYLQCSAHVSLNDDCYWIIGRGLQKNGTALSDLWTIRLSDLRLSRVDFDDVELAPLYGERAFVIDQDQLFLYGGRTEQRCCHLVQMAIDAGEEEEEEKVIIRGIVTEVDFPFTRRASLAHGSVNVFSSIRDDDDRVQVIFFGGQQVEVMSNSNAFSVGNLLEEELPTEVQFVILEFLDRVSLCSLRAVSNSWSLSLLSSHNLLWESIFIKEFKIAKELHPYAFEYHVVSRVDAIEEEEDDEETLFKRKCQAAMSYAGERRQQREKYVRFDERVKRRDERFGAPVLKDFVGYVDDLERLDEEELLQMLLETYDEEESEGEERIERDEIHFNLVCVGDGAVGKTSQLISQSCNSFPEDYCPVSFDDSETRYSIGNSTIILHCKDTTGSEGCLW